MIRKKSNFSDHMSILQLKFQGIHINRFKYGLSQKIYFVTAIKSVSVTQCARKVKLLKFEKAPQMTFKVCQDEVINGNRLLRKGKNNYSIFFYEFAFTEQTAQG